MIYILAHDIGTSSTKSSLVSPAGVVVASENTPHESFFGQGGIVEQDASDWWRGVCGNTRALLERDSGYRNSIAAIGVSGQMIGCLPLDAKGVPLRKSMIHSDTRSTREAAYVTGTLGARAVYELTGNIADARSPVCKMLWMKKNEPELYSRTRRFVQSKDFVVGMMTGSFATTDLSDAGHAQWIDIRKKEYASDLFSSLGLDTDLLPELHVSTEIAGKLSSEAAEALGLPEGLPVSVGGGDGACASAGAGAVKHGDTYCCLGTTAWITSIVPEPFIDERARVFNVVCLDGKACGVYGTAQNAGRSAEWAMHLFDEKDFSAFDEILSAVPPGCDGLIFLPYLEGERTPIWDAKARGVFFGINPAHRKEHFIRASVEGVSFALRSILDIARERGPLDSLCFIGGGVKSEYWQQMLADILGVKIQLLSTKAADATSLGAAVAAGVGIGLYKDLADGCRSVRIEQERAPDTRLAEVYDRAFALYSSLYKPLAPFFSVL